MARSVSANTAVPAEETGNSDKKRNAILEAATSVFLKSGYLGSSMDEIALLAQVSKQTVYKQFSSKGSLFVEIVTSMTDTASARVHNEVPELTQSGEIADFLQLYAFRQLSVVLTPPLMQLRRLVIGEVSRFPDLARVLYERGPQRAIASFAKVIEHLAARDLLAIDDPMTAASNFNWLVMSEPLNRAMLLGDKAIPKQAVLRRHAAEGVRVFLAAYGTKSIPAAVRSLRIGEDRPNGSPSFRTRGTRVRPQPWPHSEETAASLDLKLGDLAKSGVQDVPRSFPCAERRGSPRGKSPLLIHDNHSSKQTRQARPRVRFERKSWLPMENK